MIFAPMEDGRLKVYKEPDKDMIYSIGIDASTGLADDYSCIQVLTNSVPFTQVACFRAKWPVAKVTEMADKIGRWYNTALICCEINYPGNSIQDALLNYYGYPRNYKAEQHLDEDPSISPKFGFRTTETSKWMLIHEMQTVVTEKNLKINDKDTIYEMSKYVYKGSSRKAGAAQGFNDDTVMALMLALHIARLYPLVRPTRVTPAKQISAKDPDTRADWKRFRRNLINQKTEETVEVV